MGPHDQARLTCLTRVNIPEQRNQGSVVLFVFCFSPFLEERKKKSENGKTTLNRMISCFSISEGEIGGEVSIQVEGLSFLALRVPGILLFTVYFIETQFIESLALF